MRSTSFHSTIYTQSVLFTPGQKGKATLQGKLLNRRQKFRDGLQRQSKGNSPTLGVPTMPTPHQHNNDSVDDEAVEASTAAHTNTDVAPADEAVVEASATTSGDVPCPDAPRGDTGVDPEVIDASTMLGGTTWMPRNIAAAVNSGLGPISTSRKLLRAKLLILVSTLPFWVPHTSPRMIWLKC
jgi:hypothetical protein